MSLLGLLGFICLRSLVESVKRNHAFHEMQAIAEAVESFQKEHEYLPSRGELAGLPPAPNSKFRNAESPERHALGEERFAAFFPDPRGQPYVYRPHRNTFTLYSLGEDRVVSQDDIIYAARR